MKGTILENKEKLNSEKVRKVMQRLQRMRPNFEILAKELGLPQNKLMGSWQLLQSRLLGETYSYLNSMTSP